MCAHAAEADGCKYCRRCTFRLQYLDEDVCKSAKNKALEKFPKPFLPAQRGDYLVNS